MASIRAGLILSTSLLIAGTAFAQSSGTSAEAKAVLEKTAASMKINEQQTLSEITKGSFTVGDLYPFCGGPDGNYSAHGAKPALVGQSLKDLKDKTGKPIGEEIYHIAEPGKISGLNYMWPRPGGTEPVAKETYVTKIGDQVCAVGYYK